MVHTAMCLGDLPHRLLWFWKLPNQFQSKAQVYVDTQSLLRPLLRGLTIQPNTDNQVQLIVKP